MGGNVEEKELLTDDADGNESNDDMDALSGSTDEEKDTSSSEDNETAMAEMHLVKVQKKNILLLELNVEEKWINTKCLPLTG